MKKNFLIILLTIFLLPLMTKASSRYLYDALKNEVSSGLAKEYTGQHHDSFLKDPSEKIFYWYAANDENASSINEKSNVIFANHCWKTFRTTDTGGIKLLYNGAAVNNQCLDSRENHIGYSGLSRIKPQDSYYYGTDYLFDKENNVFVLAGNISTGEIKQNSYTCLKETATGQCDKLYYVLKHYYNNEYYSLVLNTNASYYEIGKLPFYYDYYTVGAVGYMYNKTYTNDSYGSTIKYVNYSSLKLASNYTHYGDGISYDEITKKYSLVNEHLIADLDDYSELEGKYILATGTNYSSTMAYYINKVNEDNLYYQRLEKGDITTSMTFGTGYTDNGDGTFTLSNPESISYSDFYKSNNKSSYNDKYFCDGESNVCSNIRYMVSANFSNNYYRYYGYNETGKVVGNSITYENGEYTLHDTNYYWNPMDNSQITMLKNHHYTCLDKSSTCASVKYIHSTESAYTYYVTLTDGLNAYQFLSSILWDDDVNTQNSVIKSGIDKWFEKDLNDYSNYLEETIYCNDRSYTSLGSWESNGGNTALNNNYLKFKNYTINSNLICTNDTDSFSINNDKAKLNYNIGLITAPEANILGAKLLKTGANYWTLSPYSIGRGTDSRIISNNGSITTSFQMDTSYGVRPVISLKPKTRFASGNGSTDNPYIIDYNEYYNVSVEIKNETKELDIELDDITSVAEGEEVRFKVTPIKGYKVTGIKVLDTNNNEVETTETSNKNEYTFIMPNHDVTIIPSYEKVSNSVIVEDNPNTKEIKIEVNDATAVVYEDKVIFTVEPEEGYEVEKIIIKDEDNNTISYRKLNNNKYEFDMPDTDVIITPVYKKIEIPQETTITVNPKTHTIFYTIIIISLLLWLGILISKARKRVA